MKRLLGLALAVTALFFAGCNKTEEEENEAYDVTKVTAPTNSSKKVVLLEEFTGINYGWCAAGHKIMNDVMSAHPGKVFGINIHTGVHSADTYTTEFGSELANQSYIKAYPVGTVNRHVFQGMWQDTVRKGTAMSCDSLAAAANIILSQPSCANIAAKAQINRTTRELTVAVAVYYTSRANGTTHVINVAVLQDSVWGSQSGAQTYNPAQYNAARGKYCHMHMLRHLVTGQWGDEITPVVGEQMKRIYTYTLPEKIGLDNVVLEHLEIVAFLAEGHQEVITACKAPIKIIK